MIKTKIECIKKNIFKYVESSIDGSGKRDSIYKWYSNSIIIKKSLHQEICPEIFMKTCFGFIENEKKTLREKKVESCIEKKEDAMVLHNEDKDTMLLR